jgi:hypothetical protein
MSEAPPKEVQRRLPHDPRLWTRNYLRHPNDPSRAYDFWDDVGPPPESFDGTAAEWDGDFLYYLADEDGPMNPKRWGDINVLLFARGCLKTFTVSTIAAWACDMYSTIETVVTAPRDDQREEVIDRFKQKVEQSGMVERRVKDNIGHQKFHNKAVDSDTGETYPAYSHLKSRSAWGEGDALRGLHGHIGIIDESQDVDEGTFSTFLEAIDRQVPEVDYFPTIFVIGTPKMANTFFHRLWNMSDKKTWDAEEKEWVAQEEAQEFLPDEMKKRKAEVQEKLKELREKRRGVSERGNEERVEELTDLIDKFEDELDDLEGFTVRGWHIDQENSPIHRQRDIAFKRETYSKRKFENEVNAHFYSPENDLITNDDVWETAFIEERFQPEPQYPNTMTFLGVDWGGGEGEGAASTVVTVAEETPDGEDLELLNIEIMSSDMSAKEEREFIDKWMRQYGVDIAVVDEGFGSSDRETLQDEYGWDDSGQQNLYGCWYGNVKDKEEIKWNRFNNERRFFTAAKTFMVENMAEDFKDGHIKIPKEDLSFDSKQSDGSKIVDQLTAPYTEKKTIESGKTKKVIKSERNDDVFDALTYVWMAANKVRSRRTVKSVGTHTRKGY